MPAIFGAQPDARAKREALIASTTRRRLMEQYKHEDAVKQFKQAIASDPAFAIASYELALAYYFLRDLRNAQSEARSHQAQSFESGSAVCARVDSQERQAIRRCG
jgi:tetratricopeptide (TPR) repeat protein